MRLKKSKRDRLSLLRTEHHLGAGLRRYPQQFGAPYVTVNRIIHYRSTRINNRNINPRHAQRIRSQHNKEESCAKQPECSTVTILTPETSRILSDTLHRVSWILFLIFELARLISRLQIDLHEHVGPEREDGAH